VQRQDRTGDQSPESGLDRQELARRVCDGATRRGKRRHSAETQCAEPRRPWAKRSIMGAPRGSGWGVPRTVRGSCGPRALHVDVMARSAPLYT